MGQECLNISTPLVELHAVVHIWSDQEQHLCALVLVIQYWHIRHYVLGAQEHCLQQWTGRWWLNVCCC